ncbi:hypothetical protein CVT24_007190, partial [Panaeolus cyanescens]
AVPLAPSDPVQPSDPAPTPAKQSEPAYRHSPLICNPELASRITNRFLDVPITMTARELLAVAPDLRSQVCESITTQQVATKESAIISVSQHKDVSLKEDEKAILRTVLLNQELISKPPVCHSSSHHHPVSVFSVNGAPDPSETSIRLLPQEHSPDLDHLTVASGSPEDDILLGRPFEVISEAFVQHSQDSSQVMTLSDPDTGQAVTPVPTKPCSRRCCCNSEEFMLDSASLLSECPRGGSPVLCIMICALLILLPLLWVSLALVLFKKLTTTASAAIY